MTQKTALVLTGLPRDFERASHSIKRDICIPLGIDPQDIYLSVWDDVGYWQPGDSKSLRSFYPGEKVPAELLSAVYPNAVVELESFAAMETYFNRILSDLPEVYLPSIAHSNFLARGINVVSMFYKIQRGLNLVPKGKYERIVRTRPDIVLSRRLNPRHQSRFQVLRQRNHLGTGLGDNLHIGSESQQEAICSIFSNLRLLFEQQRGLVCPHLFVETALREKSIPVKELRIGYSTLHTPGGQYHALNSKGQWVRAEDSDYSRSDKSFEGNSGPK